MLFTLLPVLNDCLEMHLIIAPVCVCVVYTVGAEVVLGGVGQWMVSTGTQTREDGDHVQINVPLQQVNYYPTATISGNLRIVSLARLSRGKRETHTSATSRV